MPTTASTSAPASGSAPAARPAELPLDRVRPCELVGAEVRAQFRIDRPDAPNAGGCTFISSTTGSYLVVLEPEQGVDTLGRPAEATVGGFPAVDIRRPGVRIGHLSIDVADGQRLDVEVQRLAGDGPVDEVYQDTMRFAEAVLATLRQQLGR